MYDLLAEWWLYAWSTGVCTTTLERHLQQERNAVKGAIDELAVAWFLDKASILGTDLYNR